MSDALAAWLLAQRWFRSKQRPIASVTEHDRAPLGDAALVILEVAYADGGGPDHYLVPDVGGREPRDGEGAWTAIVQGMADGAQLRGLRGSFSCSRTARPRRAAPVGQPLRRRIGRAAAGCRAVQHLGRAGRPSHPEAVSAPRARPEPGPRGEPLPGRCGLCRHARRRRRHDLGAGWRRAVGRGHAPGIRSLDRRRLGGDARPPGGGPRARRGHGRADRRGDRTDARRARVAARGPRVPVPRAQPSPRRRRGARRPSASSPLP